MCGILGVRRSWRDDPSRFDAALRVLGWRGPDDARKVTSGDFVLGVARLTISDPKSPQPIVCPRTGRVVVFNGAVTSAAEEWPRFAGRLQGRNDAELLLQRFAEDGPSSLCAHGGGYAFGLWDPQAEELWLGRDPRGEKPLLCVHDGRRVVAFASSLDALEALGLRFAQDTAMAATALRFGASASPRCIDEGLCLSGDLRGLCVARGDGPPLLPWHADRFRAAADDALPVALRAAVTRCATAEPAVAVALSGGIDSAVIAACLAEGERLVPAYQCRFAGDDEGERSRAQAVADRLGLELREVDVDVGVLDHAAALSRHATAPLGDPSVLVTHALARAVARDGVRVLLSGEGSDELLLGYSRHAALRALDRRRLLRLALRALPADGLAHSRIARLARAARAPDPHASLLEVAPPSFRAAVLTPDFAHGTLPDTTDARFDAVRARELDFYLRFDLLPKFDLAGMAAGIEGRCPFLDPQVVDAAARMAPDAVRGKRPLREAFAAHLPRGHFAQRKRGFAVPIDRFWRDSDLLADILLDPRSLQREHLRADGVRAMVARQCRGDVRLGHALWLLVAQELWLRAREEVHRA
ncbi:MAG: asparagine synthetase B [Planctomycetota bacterium]